MTKKSITGMKSSKERKWQTGKNSFQEFVSI